MAKGYSSDKNFKKFLRYGNHKSCAKYAKEFKEVMVKDAKRGNTILVDEWLLYFVPNLYLTPQAMVDVNNIWKNSRPVFDSSFRSSLDCEAFNDWVDKITEGECYFPGSFKRFLTWVWNLRISYPFLAIYLCDDDIKNAFRLIKHNPAIILFNAF